MAAANCNTFAMVVKIAAVDILDFKIAAVDMAAVKIAAAGNSHFVEAFVVAY